MKTLNIQAGASPEIPGIRGGTMVTYVDMVPGICRLCHHLSTIRALMIQGVLTICRNCEVFEYQTATYIYKFAQGRIKNFRAN